MGLSVWVELVGNLWKKWGRSFILGIFVGWISCMASVSILAIT